eukprot:180525-Chlamydomonas_euryale.AAC.10
MTRCSAAGIGLLLAISTLRSDTRIVGSMSSSTLSPVAVGLIMILIVVIVALAAPRRVVARYGRSGSTIWPRRAVTPAARAHGRWDTSIPNTPIPRQGAGLAGNT